MNDNKVVVSGGLTFTGALTIAFTVLKLMGVIDWSWLWVLAPTWIPFVLAVIVLVIILVLRKSIFS